MKLPYRCLNEFEKELLRDKKRKNLQTEFQKEFQKDKKEFQKDKKEFQKEDKYIPQNKKIFLI